MSANIVNIAGLPSINSFSSPIIVVYGESKDLETRSIVKRMLKGMLGRAYNVENIEESWSFETNQTVKSPADFINKCEDVSLLGDVKFHYFDNIAKIKALSKFKFSVELDRIKVNNFIILDYYGKKPKKDLELITCNGAKPLFVDCNRLKLFSAEHKGSFNSIALFFHNKLLDRNLLEYLVKKYEYSYNSFLQDLFFMDLVEGDLSSLTLTPELFDQYSRDYAMSDLKKLLGYLVSKNVYKALDSIDSLYRKQDATYYLVTSIYSFLDKLLFIKRNPTLNPYELSSRLWIRASEIDYYKGCLVHWDDVHVKKATMSLIKLEDDYSKNDYDPKLGKLYFEQFIQEIASY